MYTRFFLPVLTKASGLFLRTLKSTQPFPLRFLKFWSGTTLLFMYFILIKSAFLILRKQPFFHKKFKCLCIQLVIMFSSFIWNKTIYLQHIWKTKILFCTEICTYFFNCLKPPFHHSHFIDFFPGNSFNYQTRIKVPPETFLRVENVVTMQGTSEGQQYVRLCSRNFCAQGT